MNEKYFLYRRNADGSITVNSNVSKGRAWADFERGIMLYGIQLQPHNDQHLLFELLNLYEGISANKIVWECNIGRVHCFNYPHQGVYVLPDVPRSTTYDNAHRAYIARVKYADRGGEKWHKTAINALDKLIAQVAGLELTAKESAFLIGEYKGMMI